MSEHVAFETGDRIPVQRRGPVGLRSADSRAGEHRADEADRGRTLLRVHPQRVDSGEFGQMFGRGGERQSLLDIVEHP